MDAYDRRMAAMREGDLLPPDPNAYDFNADMNAVRSAHRKKPVHQEFTREQLEELRQVQKERDEVTFRTVLPKRATTTHLLHRLVVESFWAWKSGRISVFAWTNARLRTKARVSLYFSP